MYKFYENWGKEELFCERTTLESICMKQMKPENYEGL